MKKSIRASLLVGAMLHIYVPEASAQATSESDEVPAQDVAEDGTITVTAQRREQSKFKIPLSVSSIGATEIDRQGVIDVTQLTSVSPSLNVSNAVTTGTTLIRLRGVGTTSTNIGFESAVAVFIDGAYQSRPAVALAELVDVERIEVLKGPQGTLFGRNTSAGAISIINRKPDLDEFGGFVNATYGNYDQMSVQSAINVPIVRDTLAIRLSGGWRDRDGFVDLVGPDGRSQPTNDLNQQLYRGQLRYLSESGLELRIIGDYAKRRANCCAPVELLESSIETSGRYAQVGLGQTGGMFGRSRATSPFDVRAARASLDDRIGNANFQPFSTNEQWGVTSELTIPVAASADLIYIASYRDFESDEGYDADFSAIDVFNVRSQRASIETWTHELRLQGSGLADRLSWMVGGYYFKENIDQRIQYELGRDYNSFVAAALLPATGGRLDPLGDFSGGVNAAGAQSLNQNRQDSESWSVFTHNTFEIAPRLNVVLGLRYSDERKDGSFRQLSNSNALCPAIASNLLGSPVAGARPIPAGLRSAVTTFGCLPFTAPVDSPAAQSLPLPRSFSNRFEDSELIYTAKLSYDVGPNALAYAGFTHGYKAGGFNLDNTAAIGGRDPRFDSEIVDAYEAGLKGRFFGNAVEFDLSLFHQEFRNFQISEFTGVQFQSFNVPKAKSTGFDLEMTLRPRSHFNFDVGLSYADARYPADCASPSDALRVQNLCGFRLTNAPEWTGIMGASYENNLSTEYEFFVNGQIRFESDRRTATQARVVPTSAAQLGQTALTPFDVQDGNVKINLRTGIGRVDGKIGLEVWALNLTNEITQGVSFNTTLRTGSVSAIPENPRTYGVTIRSSY